MLSPYCRISHFTTNKYSITTGEIKLNISAHVLFDQHNIATNIVRSLSLYLSNFLSLYLPFQLSLSRSISLSLSPYWSNNKFKRHIVKLLFKIRYICKVKYVTILHKYTIYQINVLSYWYIMFYYLSRILHHLFYTEYIAYI